jgi:hypothetical protein
MVSFSKKELQYIKDQFENVLYNIENLDGKKLKNYVNSIGADAINDAKEILKLDNKDRINKDIELNKKCIHSIYWICGMWVWVDRCFRTKEEVTEYVPEKEYCSIYEKIINEDE